MSEGDGEAMYEIGFDDDGTIVGMPAAPFSVERGFRNIDRLWI